MGYWSDIVGSYDVDSRGNYRDRDSGKYAALPNSNRHDCTYHCPFSFIKCDPELIYDNIKTQSLRRELLCKKCYRCFGEGVWWQGTFKPKAP